MSLPVSRIPGDRGKRFPETTPSESVQRSPPNSLTALTVADPKLWPLSLHGQRGTPVAGSGDLVTRARSVRAELNRASNFGRALGDSPRIRHWDRQHERAGVVETSDLITKLTFIPDSACYPLTEFGLAESPDAALVRDRFPDWETDGLDAQAALAFLLLKNRVTVSVTLGPNADLELSTEEEPMPGQGLPPGSVKNPPLAFDQSHQGHRSSQAFLWHRLYRVTDTLIDLLKGEPFGTSGESLWDRTLIYIATEFGRTRSRPTGAEEWSSGHDQNNGVVLLSPLVNGNRVLGGVDPSTTRTFGFDPQTGEPDPGREMTEEEIYAGILGALRIDTSGSGLSNVSAMCRA